MWVPDAATDPWALRDHVETYLAEDDVLVSARADAARSGCVPVGPDAGAGLRFLAATIGARWRLVPVPGRKVYAQIKATMQPNRLPMTVVARRT